MPTTSSTGLLRRALALKLGHVQLAARSYLRDRTNQARGAVTGYAVAGGLFGAAGIFLIAACLVGATALFRWIEFNYGLFPAFGAIGFFLLVAAGICTTLAVISLKRPPPKFPTLASRLRVAIRANPVHPGESQLALNTTASNMPSATVGQSKSGPRPGPEGPQVSAGMIFVAIMLGWAAARRWRYARKAAVPDRRS
jgi:hypothetical protein